MDKKPEETPHIRLKSQKLPTFKESVIASYRETLDFIDSEVRVLKKRRKIFEGAIKQARDMTEKKLREVMKDHELCKQYDEFVKTSQEELDTFAERGTEAIREEQNSDNERGAVGESDSVAMVSPDLTETLPKKPRKTRKKRK